MGIEELFRALQWPVAGSILSGCFYVVYRIWRFFTGDFLGPYREDLGDVRERLERTEEKADTALERAQLCEEREGRLRFILATHGIDVPTEESP